MQNPVSPAEKNIFYFESNKNEKAEPWTLLAFGFEIKVETALRAALIRPLGGRGTLEHSAGSAPEREHRTCGGLAGSPAESFYFYFFWFFDVTFSVMLLAAITAMMSAAAAPGPGHPRGVEHPRLFFSAGDVGHIRAKASDGFMAGVIAMLTMMH